MIKKSDDSQWNEHESPPRLLRKKDAADFLRVSVRTFSRWLSEGTAPESYDIGGSKRWDIRVLINWVNSGQDGERGRKSGVHGNNSTNGGNGSNRESAKSIFPRLVRAEEFARILRMSPRTLSRKRRGGFVPQPMEILGPLRWNLDVVRDWINRGCPPVGSDQQ